MQTTGLTDYEWTCPTFCEGPTSGTIVFDYIHETSTDTVGYIGINHDQRSIILAFRGSRSIRNWMDDLLIIPSRGNVQNVLYSQKMNHFQSFFAKIGSKLVPPETVRVHYGFFRSYGKVARKVRSRIKSLYQSYNVSDYNLTVTGHSLGAAIGCLAAADLFLTFPKMLENKIKLVTFGQPRTGNLAFVNWYRGLPFYNQIFRITRFNDPVPRLPAAFLGYAHVGDEYFMDSFRHIWKCPTKDNQTESEFCANVGRVLF